MIPITQDPKPGTFYLATAIPYVNAAPHLGHCLEFIQADCVARFQRSIGQDVFFGTGSDDNSIKNVHAAEAKNITPAQLCEANAAVFQQMADRAGMTYSVFHRSSVQADHWAGVQKLWQQCNQNGDIYKKKYSGLYCVGCESFYEESELPEGVCPEHQKKPERVEEENYFFRLSKYQQQLEQLIESDRLKIYPETRKNEVLSFIRGGLQDFSISRSVVRAKSWGVPVPGDPTQFMYVWFDALGYYLTCLHYGQDEQLFQKYWPVDLHIIGKGIIRFHAIYWPAMLLSAQLSPPRSVFVHGYITVDGQKMSKSIGNIVDPIQLIAAYGADPLRYCLLDEISTFDDGDFSERVLVEKNNNELLANFGNLVNRTLVFIKNNFDARVPSGAPGEKDQAFLQTQLESYAAIRTLLEQYRLKEALDTAMLASKRANVYFQENKPWELVKTDKARAGAVLRVLAHQVKDLAILLSPFLPHTSEAIFQQLAVQPQRWEDLGKPSLSAGHKIGEPKVLFRKLEPPQKAAVVIAEPVFNITPQASALGIRAAAAIIEPDKISNKSALLEAELKSVPSTIDDSGYVRLHQSVGAPEQTSVRSLHELARKNALPNINTLVDAYNLISLRRGISAGAHDISAIRGNVRIDICHGQEPFHELGSSVVATVPKGEYAALDDEKVICRLELKQCEQTKVTKNSKHVLLYYEGSPGHTQEQVDAALLEACELIRKLCGGGYTILYPKTDSKHPKNTEAPVSFSALDIEVGEIIAAERHPQAEKLLVEQVKLGDKTIQLVSGIAAFYKPEEIVGRKVLVLRNISSAKLRGIESQGMLLLCVGLDKTLEIISPEAAVGTKVVQAGAPEGTPAAGTKPVITIGQFFSVTLEIRDHAGFGEGKALLAGTAPLRTEKIKDGKIT